MRTALFILFAAARVAVAEPKPVEFMWNNSPPPFKTYVACGTAADADHCVQPGTWVVVCQDGQDFHVKSEHVDVAPGGELAIADPACPKPSLVVTPELAAKVGIKAGEDLPWAAICLGSGRASFRRGTDATVVAMHASHGRLELDRYDFQGKGTCASLSVPMPPRKDLPFVQPNFGKDVKLGAWRIADVIATPEPLLVLAAELTDSAPNEVAVLVRVTASQAEQLGATSSEPRPHTTPAQRAVREVQRAKEDCDHWSGEEPYDAARAKEIATQSKSACDGFHKKLAAAKKRYPNEPALKHLDDE